MLIGTGAFTVSPPITVTLTGSAKQGSVVSADLHSIDPDNFFDANAANFTVSAPGLYSLGNSNITPNDVTAILLVPPAATPGNVQITGAERPLANALLAERTGRRRRHRAGADRAHAPVHADRGVNRGRRRLGLRGGHVARDRHSQLHDRRHRPELPFLPEGIIFPPSGLVADVVGVLAPPTSLFGPAPPPYRLIASIPNTAATPLTTSLVLSTSRSAEATATRTTSR